jgi:NTE family protein
MRLLKIQAVLAVALAAQMPRFAQAQQSQTPSQAGQKANPMPQVARDSGAASATTNVDSSELRTGHAPANPTDLPAVVPAGRKSIGLALEGGGALGLAHIGVIRWLEEHRIPVDRISGTSMGSLVGGLYASGHTPAEMEQIATGKSLDGIFVLSQSYSDVSFRRREDQSELPQAIQFGLKGGLSFRDAVVEDGGLNSLLRRTLDRYNREGLSFDRLPIPFRCVATDLNTMQAVVFFGGPLPQAIRASISIPGVFSPVEYRRHYLVDGAIMDNLPTDIVKDDLHADVVIAVDLESPSFVEGDVSSLVGVLARAYAAGTAKNERAGKQLADILIKAETGKFSTSAYDKAAELIAAGYAAANAQKNELLPYQLNEADWKAYTMARSSRMQPPLPALQIVKVEGGGPGTTGTVQRSLEPLLGQPQNADGITNALRAVQGNGGYRANFETFAPTDSLSAKNANAGTSQDGVLVRLSKVKNGPPFLLFGADIAEANSNVTRTTFDARVYDPNFGGFGSELRADIRVGFLSQLSTEYYRSLSPAGYFFQPRVGITRQPVYLWENQVRVSERLQQNAGGGLEFGRTFSRNMQASMRWNADVVRWHLVSGNDGTSTVSGITQTAVVHYVYDSTTSGLVSPSGFRVEATAGALYNSSGSQNAPLLRLSAIKSTAFVKGIFGASIEANSYLKRNVAEPLRFTVGGPLRLSASSIDEYRGTDDVFLSAGYSYRISSLPLGIGEGLYASFGYEGAAIWAPNRTTILRGDGALMGVAATPIGVIKFGGSVGDAGRRKIFFAYGKFF